MNFPFTSKLAFEKLSNFEAHSQNSTYSIFISVKRSTDILIHFPLQKQQNFENVEKEEKRMKKINKKEIYPFSRFNKEGLHDSQRDN